MHTIWEPARYRAAFGHRVADDRLGAKRRLDRLVGGPEPQDGHFVYEGEVFDAADLTYVRFYDRGPDDTGGVPACGPERPIVCVQSSAGVIPIGSAQPPTPGPGCHLTEFGLAHLAACPGAVSDLQISVADAP